MRIAIITSWFTDVISGSGTGVFFNSFVGGLRERGYEVEVIAPTLTQTDYVNITLERFLFNAQLAVDPRIRNADVLIGFDYDGYGILPTQRPPMITSAHAIFGDVIQWEREPVRTMVQAQAYFDRAAMRAADCVTCGSDYARQRIIDLYGITADKITTIHHGMEIPSWVRLATTMTRRENDHPVLLAVGKMYPRKRLDILLRALPVLIAQHPTLELRVIGDGLEYDAMRALSRELGVDEQVTWLGHVADEAAFACEWLQADIFCHPSLQETFGFVYLEALMMGKPIVASRAGAAPEVVGDAGLLTPPDDSAAFGEAIHRLISDGALRQQLGERGRLRAGLFTREKMITAYTAIIESLTT
jgi:glycosyltransferase involved in cell wall biosynthesis